MTNLVPNADEAERQRLPGGGASVRLSWVPDRSTPWVRESAAATQGQNLTAPEGRAIQTEATATRGES